MPASDRPAHRITITITVTGYGRPVYMAELGGVSSRLSGQTEARDLVARVERECRAAGVELEVDGNLDPALIAAWLAPVKGPAG